MTEDMPNSDTASDISTPSIDLSSNNIEVGSNHSDFDEDSWSVIFSTDDTNSDSETRSNVSDIGNSTESSSNNKRPKERTPDTSYDSHDDNTIHDKEDSGSVSVSTLRNTPNSVESSFTFPSIKINQADAENGGNQPKQVHSSQSQHLADPVKESSTTSPIESPKTSSFNQLINYFESLKNQEKSIKLSNYKETKLYNSSKDFVHHSHNYMKSFNDNLNLNVHHYIVIGLSILALISSNYIYGTIYQTKVIEPVSTQSNIISSFDFFIHPTKAEPVIVQKCFLKYLCYEKTEMTEVKSTIFKDYICQAKSKLVLPSGMVQSIRDIDIKGVSFKFYDSVKSVSGDMSSSIKYKSKEMGSLFETGFKRNNQFLKEASSSLKLSAIAFSRKSSDLFKSSSNMAAKVLQDASGRLKSNMASNSIQFDKNIKCLKELINEDFPKLKANLLNLKRDLIINFIAAKPFIDKNFDLIKNNKIINKVDGTMKDSFQNALRAPYDGFKIVWNNKFLKENFKTTNQMVQSKVAGCFKNCSNYVRNAAILTYSVTKKITNFKSD